MANTATVTESEFPQRPVMVRKSYASPLSFMGSTQRLIWGTDSWPWWVAVPTLVLVLPVVWCALLMWYAVIFGVFGVFVMPYRLHRRAQRKAAHVATVSLATQQAMLNEYHGK